MPKTIKNTMAWTVAACMAVQLLTACERSSNLAERSPVPEGQPGSASLYEEPGLSKYDPPIQLSFVRENNDALEEILKELPGESLEHNRWTELYEEVLGIRVTYDWTEWSSIYSRKLGVSLASGDIPDIVRVNASQLRVLSNAGLIQDLSEVYDEYATPLTRKVLSEEGTGPFETVTLDGKLMAIPETNSSIEGAMFLWIRTDWLERLGLQPPQTMAEVLAISKAFTQQDPDGNGKHDTYGLAVTKYLWDPVMGLTGFMAGYGAYPGIWIKDKTGKLVYGGIQPEVKHALQVLQELYRTGQIDREFAFKDGVKASDWIEHEQVGMMYGEQWGSFLVQSSREHNPQAEWQAFPLVSESGAAPKVPLPFSTNQFLAVKQGVQHPEALIKLINLHLEKNWGATSEVERYYNAPQAVWKLSPVTPFPVQKNLEAFRELETFRRNGDASVLQDEAKTIQKRIAAYEAGGADSETGWGWERTYGPSGAFSILDGYERKSQLLYESFVGAPTETMIEKQNILNNLQIDAFLDIIQGRPLSGFDNFVAQWNKLGGEQITAEVNDWYAEKGGSSK
ncbi:putative aldouronate transport system substrate-binding protein [Paenibacillus silagei]|uniref:Aldouronate transport system substrate-binding protein n=2 Tax=Paenibacillus silagei TaxID=1670801 RepID=A0ABS4NUB3_9BACL|nr:putative aldouronate transport system substrate-binding protein [Paenibacillus silagei]